MRRRIWSEFLPPQELGQAATVALCRRFGLEPIVALPPQAETPAMAEALARLTRADIRLGLWPLLPDEDGYWPSESNAEAFVDRARVALAFAAAAGARVATLAVDLEPPLALTRQLAVGSLRARASLLAEEVAALRHRARRRARRAAVARFSGLQHELCDARIETLAAVLPPIVLDLASDTRVWQAVFRTPTTRPGWSVISPMMYTSAIAALLPRRSAQVARIFLYEAGRALARGIGRERTSLSLGLVAPGKLGHEPAYASPAELGHDVAAARAAGVDDLALFSLDGVLGRGAPEDWLVPYTATPPRRAAGLGTSALSGLVRGLGWGAVILARSGGPWR
jgi:hypothetical protein